MFNITAVIVCTELKAIEGMEEQKQSTLFFNGRAYTRNDKRLSIDFNVFS